MTRNRTSDAPRHARGARAIAYLRVSTRVQETDGLGLAVQKDRVREYAEQHKLDLIDIVTETASGGVQQGEALSWEHRPKLLALLDRAEKGEYEILLVAKLDRLSRDHATLVVLERMLARHGVEVVSVAEEHNGDGPLAELIRGQLALIAQFERAQIRERFNAGKAKGKTLGRHVHGRHPYGYHAPTRGQLEPDPATAPIVKKIFDLARQGTNPSRIAGVLNHEGIAPPQKAKAWSRAAIHLMLSNPAYIGERHGIKRAHRPIIDRSVFLAIQESLASRSRRKLREDIAD
ncbi:MAG: recombinase family protein [Thermoleophilia bacterium]